MKYLILLLLFITSCTDKTQEYSPEEFARSLAARKNVPEPKPIITQEIIPNFSMYDKYFTREQLFPIFILQDTIFEDLMDINIETDLIEYSNSGQALGYTNKYGLFFFENKKQLVSLQELSNITTPLEGENSRKLEFFYTAVFKATSVEEMCNKLDDSAITLQHMITFNDNVLSDYIKVTTGVSSAGFNTPYYKYILNKSVGENIDQIKNAMLNGLILNLYNFSGYDRDWTDIPQRSEEYPSSKYPVKMNGTYTINYN